MRTLSRNLAFVGFVLAQTAPGLQSLAKAQSGGDARYDDATAILGATELPLGARPGLPTSGPLPASADHTPLQSDARAEGAAKLVTQPDSPEEIHAHGAGRSSATQSNLPLGAARADSPTLTQPSSAKEWIAHLLTPPNANGLDGNPLTLGQAMEGSSHGQRQMEIVTAYWQLAVAVAKYHAAVSGSATGPEAETEMLRSRLKAIQAQHRLAQVLQLPQGQLPLPASQPHVGSYNTRHDEIYADRFSRSAWELEETLPLRYEIVRACAEALSRSSAGNAEFREAANEFADAVGDYNLAIAEYALLAAGDSLNGRDLVPLLIRTGREEDQLAGESPDRSPIASRQRRLAAVPGAANSSQPPASTGRGGTLSLQNDAQNGWRQRTTQPLGTR